MEKNLGNIRDFMLYLNILIILQGLKQCFLSDKTQIFFKKSVHKGLNYICEFFGKDLSIISVFK